MFICFITNGNKFSNSNSLSIVSSLQQRREALLLQSLKGSSTKRALKASSLSSSLALTKKKPVKFSSPVLEQIFSGLSAEQQAIILGKKIKGK